MEQTLNNLLDISNNQFIKTLVVILLALITQVIIKAILKSALQFPLNSDIFPNQKRDREKRIKTLNSIVSALAIFAVWFVAGLIIMGIYNIPVGPLLTSAGLVGAALAFGTQSLIRDFISGIFIIAENQYRVDDYIKLDKAAGKVVAITMRTTVLRDADGSLHHIPNGSIALSTNLSMGPIKAKEQLELASEESIASFTAKLNKIASKIEKDPELSRLIKSGPGLETVNKITGKSTTVTIVFSTTTTKRDAATGALLQAIKESTIKLA